MSDKVYTVKAEWDPEARVWVATSDDVPGLVAEAETMDALVQGVKRLAPELFELNLGLRGPAEVLLVVVSKREEHIRLPAA
jgi:Domain of unknown function (DUF1902).